MSLIKKRQSDSHFWKSILEAKEVFYRNCKRVVGNGKSTSFWNDCWCGPLPLSVRFKRLFELSLNKEIRVDVVLNSSFESLTFRRRLVGVDAENLNELESRN